MKVRVTLTLDIDAAAWADEYGLERDQVRQDVQDHVRHMVRSHLAQMDLLSNATDQSRTRLTTTRNLTTYRTRGRV